MVNEEKYFDELQKIIGETKSADMINEHWSEVLERLESAVDRIPPKNSGRDRNTIRKEWTEI